MSGLLSGYLSVDCQYPISPSAITLPPKLSIGSDTPPSPVYVPVFIVSYRYSSPGNVF